MRLILLHITILFFVSVFGADVSVMQPGDPEPLYEPDAVQFSFDTPGWFVLAGVVVLAGILVIFWQIHQYRRNAYRREALEKINAITHNLHQRPGHPYINDIMVVLRWAALKAFGRNQVAPLFGEQWLRFLDSKVKNSTFITHRDLILNAIYKNEAGDAKHSQVVIELAKRWIKSHA
jgi:hypothetical protein